MELGAQGMGRDMVYSEAGGTPREKDNLVTEKVPDEGNKKQKEWEKKKPYNWRSVCTREEKFYASSLKINK